MYVQGIRSLFAFPGWVVSSVHLAVDLAQVHLRRDGRRRLTCPHCAARMTPSRTLRQTASDLPLGIARDVLLIYDAVQGRCRSCDRYATIRPPGIDDHAQATDRLMRFVSALCQHLSLNQVSQVVPSVDASKAYRWDRKVLARGLPPPKLDGLRVLLIDEKSVRKGHGYVTLVMNGDTGELLHLAEGKKAASLQSFFDKLDSPQKSSIEAVGMDRGGAYRKVVKHELPEAAIVFDKFHLIRNYHEVIDRVRNLTYRAADLKDRAVFKGQRFNLYRNPSNLRDTQRHSLRALLAINADLNTVYVMKEALKELWEYPTPHWAGYYLDWWLDGARDSKIKPLIRFAGSIHKARDEVLNFCRYPITLGPLEGFNNLVSRLIHRACGIRDLEYLFMKLRQASLS